MSITISEEQLIKYMEIYKETCGQSISRKMAYAQAIKLINLTKALVDHTVRTSRSQKTKTLQDNIDNK